MSRAVTVGDLAHAKSLLHKRRVEQAIRIVDQGLDHGRMGIAFSGGKDSTCTLHLVRRQCPDAPAGFFDSGCEYESTYALVAALHVTTIHPERSMVEMRKLSGGFGYRGPEADSGRDFDYFAFLVGEPSIRFCREAGLDVIAIGLRAGESAGRRMGRIIYGPVHSVRWHPAMVCHPVCDWTDSDVWAYIATNDLAYNAAYDRMAEAGLPRKAWRVSTLLGTIGASIGRHAIVRIVDPALFNRLAGTFPEFGRLS